MDISITPTFIKMMNELLVDYSNKTLSISGTPSSIKLLNDIGPQSKIELFENINSGDTEKNVLICSKTYEKQDSCPNSPAKHIFTSDFNDDTNEDKDR